VSLASTAKTDDHHIMLLENKTVVVTGGNSGIGEAIVRAAAAAGANVVIDYINNAARTESIVADIRGAGGNAIGFEADVTDVDALDRLAAAAADAFGGLDVWVNNAGISTKTGLLDTTAEQFDRVIAVNLRGAFFGTQIAARRFIAQGSGGVVLNISSTHEDWPMPGNIAYCTSKGGIRMITRTAGVELGRHGIRVVNLAPGAVNTRVTTPTMADKIKRTALAESIPLGYIASPDDIAAAAVALCSDQSRYITATTVVVDGGLMQNSHGL
jgi:glucose 1-dehydrogenase